jgi:Fe2+ transport system protein FeoA
MGMTETKLLTLAELKPGESAVVASVGGTDALHRRLLDMGLTPGVKVLLQKTAPMGDPLEIHLRGYALTLRVEDAKKIELRYKNVSDEGGERV